MATTNRLTPEEAREWRRRWQAVNEAEIEELRATPMETKFRQLAAMMASRDLFPPDRDEDESVVWELWQRLRMAYRV